MIPRLRCTLRSSATHSQTPPPNASLNQTRNDSSVANDRLGGGRSKSATTGYGLQESFTTANPMTATAATRVQHSLQSGHPVLSEKSQCCRNPEKLLRNFVPYDT